MIKKTFSINEIFCTLSRNNEIIQYDKALFYKIVYVPIQDIPDFNFCITTLELATVFTPSLIVLHICAALCSTTKDKLMQWEHKPEVFVHLYQDI